MSASDLGRVKNGKQPGSDRVPMTSGLPPEADIFGVGRHVSNVPIPEVMSRANILWGAPRIHDELLKLGFEVAQSTVARYMCRHSWPPSQELADVSQQSRP